MTTSASQKSTPRIKLRGSSKSIDVYPVEMKPGGMTVEEGRAYLKTRPLMGIGWEEIQRLQRGGKTGASIIGGYKKK